MKTEREISRWKRVQVALLAAVGSALLRLLGRTWRVRREHPEHLDGPLARGEALIFVFWHEDILPIAWAHRNRGFAPLISTHTDGEIIARIVESLGYRTVRGSSSRGGARAFLAMAQLLAQGVSVAITPDGPRGPRRSMTPGAAVLAQRTGRRILAVRACADRAWRLATWDRHQIPKPFATVSLRYSPAVSIAAASVREAEAAAPQVARLLEEIDIVPAGEE
jgi:lysophospholipid acyltransferase (LPLAT)-like uncharacterized protein